MTTRRNILTLTLAGGAALLAGCRRRVAAAPPGVPDRVLAATAAGLVSVDGDRLIRHGTALASHDGKRIFRALDTGGGTALETVDAVKGDTLGRTVLSGRWTPRTVSPDGRIVVCADTGQPVARDRTALMVVGADGTQQRFDLAGNVEPDAVTVDGTALFVLEWLPAQAPARYRVRLMPFHNGVSEPLLTRGKVPVPTAAEEEMSGTGRHAVLSPDGLVLYTLYTHQPDHQHTRDLLAGRPGATHAFVHVLHLAQRWAYCLDLPHPFGHGPVEQHALAVSPDGSRLVVADSGSGRLAVADTGALAVTAVTAMPTGTGSTTLVAGSGERVYAGSGRSVHVLDAGSHTATWTVEESVTGLALSPSGSRLYVAQPDAVRWLDAATGAAQGSTRIPGVSGLVDVR